jgi:hypothetical protein
MTITEESPVFKQFSHFPTQRPVKVDLEEQVSRTDQTCLDCVVAVDCQVLYFVLGFDLLNGKTPQGQSRFLIIVSRFYALSLKHFLFVSLVNC